MVCAILSYRPALPLLLLSAARWTGGPSSRHHPPADRGVAPPLPHVLSYGTTPARAPQQGRHLLLSILRRQKPKRISAGGRTETCAIRALQYVRYLPADQGVLWYYGQYYRSETLVEDR